MTRSIKWGILSTANIGRKLVIPALQRAENAEVIAIASRSEKAFEVANELHIPKAYTSYQGLLEDEEVEAIYIPLPNHLHREWVLKAAQAKKHILVEKPAGLTTAEVNEMISACREQGVMLMEAFMYRFHAQHKRVKQLIDEGKIGEIQMIRASFSFQMRDPITNIRMVPEYGGGALYDVGCYPINTFLYYLGLPESVYAEATYLNSKVETSATGILHYPNGIKALFDCSFTMHPRNAYEIIGTKGRIKVRYAYRPDAFERGGEMEIITESGTAIEHIVDDQYKNEVEHFAQCILSGHTPAYSMEETYRCIKVIESTYLSIKENRRVTL